MSSSPFRFASALVDAYGIPQVQWQLKRNCSVTPMQLGWTYGALCVLSLSIGVFFWLHGASLILPFAGLELMAVGAAFLVYARHAADGERIWLVGAQLVVELENAGKLSRAEFHREWVRVEPKAGDNSLIELYGQGRRIEVGRFIRPELRPALAQEIRMALRAI